MQLLPLSWWVHLNAGTCAACRTLFTVWPTRTTASDLRPVALTTPSSSGPARLPAARAWGSEEHKHSIGRQMSRQGWQFNLNSHSEVSSSAKNIC